MSTSSKRREAEKAADEAWANGVFVAGDVHPGKLRAAVEASIRAALESYFVPSTLEVSTPAAGAERPEPVEEKPGPSAMIRSPAVYAALYPWLAKAAKGCGYALGIHGSLSRDLDLLAVPWTDEARSPEELLKALAYQAGAVIGDDLVTNGPTAKPHGRLAWAIVLGGGAFVDVSVASRAPETAEQGAERIEGFVSRRAARDGLRGLVFVRGRASLRSDDIPATLVLHAPAPSEPGEPRSTEGGNDGNAPSQQERPRQDFRHPAECGGVSPTAGQDERAASSGEGDAVLAADVGTEREPGLAQGDHRIEVTSAAPAPEGGVLERLERWPKDYGINALSTGMLIEDAAAEIRRLRAENETLRTKLDDSGERERELWTNIRVYREQIAELKASPGWTDEDMWEAWRIPGTQHEFERWLSTRRAGEAKP